MYYKPEGVENKLKRFYRLFVQAVLYFIFLLLFLLKTCELLLMDVSNQLIIPQ